jgi:hypothetical protein
MDFIQLLQELSLTRNGQPLRGLRNFAWLRATLFTLLREGVTRLSISLANERVAWQHFVINGIHSGLHHLPANLVDSLYTLLAVEPEPWYRRLLCHFRSELPPQVRPCWEGQIELRMRGLVIPIHCDLLAYPGGVFLVFDLAVTAEDLARFGPPLNGSMDQ